jgi:putative ABC transport system ATP-binding protein
LLSILGCVLTADGGDVKILGNDIRSLSSHQRTLLRLHRLGFVFQRFHLVRGLTVLDNVCVPLVLRGMPLGKARQRGKPLLEAVGLGGKTDAHPRQLSAGQCQRVALARALVGDPELILADEPTASLDASNGQEVMKLMRSLTTAKGKTAIVVTHDQRIFRHADRVFWLENGQIVDSSEAQVLRAGITDGSAGAWAPDTPQLATGGLS